MLAVLIMSVRFTDECLQIGKSTRLISPEMAGKDVMISLKP